MPCECSQSQVKTAVRHGGRVRGFWSTHSDISPDPKLPNPSIAFFRPTGQRRFRGSRRASDVHEAYSPSSGKKNKGAVVVQLMSACESAVQQPINDQTCCFFQHPVQLDHAGLRKRGMHAQVTTNSPFFRPRPRTKL